MSSNIIIDNSDPTSVSISGAWTPSSYTPGYLGANYLHDGDELKGQKSVKYSPALVAAGKYEVFARWASATNRATNVPIDIVDATGKLTTVIVNQQLNNATWISLGIYQLNSTGCSVTISNRSTNGFVVADAVEFVQAVAPAVGFQAVITPTSQTSILAGQPVFVHAISSALGSDTPLAVNYQWDFGDSDSAHNTMPGFNAAHVYDIPGKYTIKFTLLNSAGVQSVATLPIIVAADNRPIVNLTTLAGLTMKPNTVYRFQSGQIYTMTAGINIPSGCLLTSYGSGTRPVLLWSASRGTGNPAFISTPNASGIVIRGLTFDSSSAYTTDTSETGVPRAIYAEGSNIAVIDCQFLNVDFAADGEATVNGYLIQDNLAPLATGLRGYFCYGLGSDYVIVGNTVANSTRQHIIRIEGVDRLNITGNNLSNLDRTSTGDPWDIAKGSIVLHQGNYHYCSANVVPSGSIGTGPLSNDTVLNDTRPVTIQWIVLENTTTPSTIEFDAGLAHATARNNTITHQNGIGFLIGAAIGAPFNRHVEDLTIQNNTVINTGSYGRSVSITGPGTVGIRLLDNLEIAPNLRYGDNQAYSVYAGVANWTSSGIIQSAGNIWSNSSDGILWANGGKMFCSPQSNQQSGNTTAAQWQAIHPTDSFQNVTIANGVKTPAVVAGAA